MVVHGTIPVMFFQEGEAVVAYTPALDLSTSGKDLQEAHKRFGEALRILIKELQEMGTLDEVLQEYGWKKSLDTEDAWIPPHFLGHLEESIHLPLGA
jgi:predicted RNase H-like HicB family nuclease